LYLEEPTTAMHVGTVMVFDPPAGGFDYDRLLTLIGARISQVPRYRQRVRELPGRLAGPVWVDDVAFDLGYHVRRSGLPRPGSDEQLQEFVGRIQSRSLDRQKPLWEVYLLEGLAKGRFAIISKTHQAMVDGVDAVDVAQLILDDRPDQPPAELELWRPRREPTDVELVVQATLELFARPSHMVEAVRGGVEDVVEVGKRVASAAGNLVAAVAHTAAHPAPESPLNTRVGAPRRFCMVRTDLEDYRRVREAFSDPPDVPGGLDVSVNDVVLATIAGGLRTWLQARGEMVYASSSIRAMVPLSIYDAEDPAATGNRITACFVDLPVGEPNAGLRLEQVSYQMRQQERGAVGAVTLAGLAGFAPPTLHHLGARLGSAVSRRIFNLVVTNVPGPQQPRYTAGARLLSSYPVIPLAMGQAVSVGVTSYDGAVCIGLNGDRAAMYDIDLLGDCLTEALAELVGAQPGEPRP
jgi:WS/DGAT/MGAT family acyltransferase